MRMWCGLLCGSLAAALLAAVAAHFAGMGFKEYVPYLRYLSAAYILYLAWKTYRSGVSSEGGCRTDLLQRLHRAADQRQVHSLQPQLLFGIRPSVFTKIHRTAPGHGTSSACRPESQPGMAAGWRCDQAVRLQIRQNSLNSDGHRSSCMRSHDDLHLATSAEKKRENKC